MDARAVYANVLMHIPEATLLEVNKYLQLALDEINSQGKETITAVTVVSPTTTPYGNPSERTSNQTFNYYTDVKCLVLPSSIVYVAKVSVNGKPYSPMSASEYLDGTAGIYTYYLNDTGDMYFATDLTEGDTVKILGRIGVSLAVLPDSYLSYLTYYVLTGLYSSEYENESSFAIYSAKLRAEKPKTMQSTKRLSWMKRNGRLY